MRRIVIALAFLIYVSSVRSQELQVAPIFSDDMVLQRNQSIPVWGVAQPQEKIIVSLANQEVSTKANKDGKWIVKIAPVMAGGPFEISIIGGKNTKKFKNVMIGDVWICSGQSNMQFELQQANNSVEEIKNANYPGIRLFTVADDRASKSENSNIKWNVCTPETVAKFSAVGYFFGRELHKELNVAVGLINSSMGATSAEAWTPMEALKADNELSVIIDDWNTAHKKNNEILEVWKEQVKKAKKEGKAPPKQPNFFLSPGTFINQPAALFNSKVAPLVPYAVKGVIWYQGESNATNANMAYQYRKLFPTMINSWRKAWGYDFPFIFVQLPNLYYTKVAWAELREAQAMTLKLPKTAMAVTIDIGDANDIHPKNKQDVGKRLALAALGTVYGKSIEYSGPMFDSYKIEGDKIRLKFTHIGSGLAIKDGDKLKGFALAGEDQKFICANAKIEGDSIVAWSRDVPRPKAVRYAWGANPICNLYNKEGLPASPFRTDDWREIKERK